jgi:hypothetical protein
MRKNNKALYEQIMKSVSREVKKALDESVDLDRRFQIRQQIYSYFEKEARDAWYQGYLEDPHEQDWYIKDYKRNFWSYYTDDLYSYVYRRVYNIDKSISYEDVTNYIKHDIGPIDIDKIIEEAHYDIIEELGEE